MISDKVAEAAAAGAIVGIFIVLVFIFHGIVTVALKNRNMRNTAERFLGGPIE